MFAIMYMLNDWRANEFILLITGFQFSMFGIILVEHSISMFLTWDCLGLASFLLISFWHSQVNCLRSSLQAFGIGNVDETLLLGCPCSTVLLMSSLTCLLLEVILLIEQWTLIPLFRINDFPKTVSLEIHVWLPQAIEGPVPVSSLLHSATLVALGFYLWIVMTSLADWSMQVIMTSITLMALTVFGFSIH